MSGFVEAAVKAAAILLVALLAMPLLRRRSAALRHWLLSAALVSVAVAPLVQWLAPSWRLPGSFQPAFYASVPRPAAGVRTAIELDAGGIDRPADSVAASSSRVTLSRTLAAIWLAGAGVGIGLLLTGLARLARIVSRSDRVISGAWADCAAQICRDYGIRRPIVLLRGPDRTLPMTWGYRRPKILIPAGADEWRGDRIRLVLAHELAHVRRADWLVHAGAELVRAVYWFNPLIWMVSRRLRHESERACDDVVLGRGVDATDYAAHLVAIVRDFRPGRLWAAAPAIVRPSSFERRVAAMLNPHLNRQAPARSARIAAFVALLAATVPIAGLAFAPSASVTLSGSIVDPTYAALPAVKLVLTNLETTTKSETQSDRQGRYEFPALSAGNYQLDAELPGFMRVSGRVAIGERNVQQDFTMPIGSLQETVSVVGGPNETPQVSDPDSERRVEEMMKKREAARCPAGAPAPAGTTPIGGNLRVPLKIKHATPQYPVSLIGTASEGIVVLNGRIGTDGTFDELNVLASAHPDFAASALEAVQQWRFDPTLLNCVPVETPIKITVHFTYRP